MGEKSWASSGFTPLSDCLIQINRRNLRNKSPSLDQLLSGGAWHVCIIPKVGHFARASCFSGVDSRGCKDRSVIMSFTYTLLISSCTSLLVRLPSLSRTNRAFCILSDDFPKPQIIIQPETTVAVLGKDIRFTCSAASSSSSPMMFAWKKDNEVLHNAEIENFAHVRAKDGEVMEYTTILHLRHVTFAHEGRYQCIITNHFGSTYSNKARLTVNGE